MNGSSLIGFLISLIVLVAIGAIFFLVIDKVAKDPFLAKIAKIVIGCLILIGLILAFAGVLGLGGGLTASPYSIVVFGVAVLVLLLVLYLVDMFLTWLGPQMGMSAGIVEAVRYVITVIALIALIYVAGTALIGGGFNWRGESFRLDRHSGLGRPVLSQLGDAIGRPVSWASADLPKLLT